MRHRRRRLARGRRRERVRARRVIDTIVRLGKVARRFMDHWVPTGIAFIYNDELWINSRDYSALG